MKTNFAILDESVDADEYDDEETWLTINSEAIDDGESEDESSPPPTDSEKFNLRRGMAERNRRLRPIAWTPFWDKSLCTQETLGCLLAHLFDPSLGEEETPGEYFELLVIVLFQIFFGFATKNLIRIRFKKKAVPSADKTNPIIYHCGCFYIHPEKYDHKRTNLSTISLTGNFSFSIL